MGWQVRKWILEAQATDRRIVQEGFRWERFFRDPSKWIDHRATSEGPSGSRKPDFENVSTGEGLWIGSEFCPPWVTTRLKNNTNLRPGGRAIDVYKRSRAPRLSTVLAALRACSSSQDLDTGRKIHAHMEQLGAGNNMFLSNALVDMYTKCNSLPDARQVLNSMEQPSVVSWNTILMGHARNGEAGAVAKVFKEMQAKGCTPNHVTLVAVLSRSCGCLAQGRILHKQAVALGLDGHPLVENALLFMYCKCGSLEEAQQVFDKMVAHHSLTPLAWNCIIAAYGRSGKADVALELYSRMKIDGYATDSVTYVAVLKAYSSLVAHGKLAKEKALTLIRRIKSQATCSGHDLHTSFRNALDDLCIQLGEENLARYK